MFKFFKSKSQSQQEKIVSPIKDVNTQNIDILYKYIENKSGIYLDKSKAIIKQKIISFCKEKNLRSIDVLLRGLQVDNIFWQEFIQIITINETYFFRENQQIINALEKYKSFSTLNILCAPSSTGEEVYSVVILALEMGIKNFKAVGIDIDKTVIKKAKECLYNERSLHRVNSTILNKYFISLANSYTVKKSVKKHTLFVESNLFENDILTLGKFDLIFSRNMFIYFKDDKKIEAYQRLELLKKNLSSKIYLGHADISSSLTEYIRKRT